MIDRDSIINLRKLKSEYEELDRKIFANELDIREHTLRKYCYELFTK